MQMSYKETNICMQFKIPEICFKGSHSQSILKILFTQLQYITDRLDDDGRHHHFIEFIDENPALNGLNAIIIRGVLKKYSPFINKNTLSQIQQSFTNFLQCSPLRLPHTFSNNSATVGSSA